MIPSFSYTSYCLNGKGDQALMLAELMANFPLWTSLTAIILAQLFKVPWNFIINHKWDWGWTINSGGMPSAHTAAVTSLATSLGLAHGWDSSSFAVSTIIGIIVMYDATGVRRQAGMHAQVLNQLAEDFSSLLNEIRQMKERPVTEASVRLKEILGHQPIEVFTGAWFGILVSIIMYWIWY